MELELRVQQLVARTRQVQETWPTLKSAAGEQGRLVKQTFGTLTRICADYLNPQGVYIDTLRPSANSGWSAEQWAEEEKRIGQELADWVNKRTESERRKHQAATEFRRRELVRNQNARIYDELEEELDELLAEPEPDTESLIELVTELLAVRPLKKDSLEPEPVPDSLARKLALHEPLFRTGHSFKPLRNALRRTGVIAGDSARLPAVAPDAEQAAPRRAPDDEFRNWFAGRRAAVAGGSCREYRREQLQEYYGLAKLEWIENERNETADGANLARRIRNGSFDIVFLLARFCSHDLQDHMKQACKESGVPFVLVQRGYGRNQISAGLRALGDRLPQRSSLPA
ncbi:MAG: hypothetical protein KF696_09245 [Planctomycetes bacterium]|nr:hypothetical protein [Planctomycetota bacterium]MCW8136771.1 hypothetical protein [Planctomycetota bacterium]